MIFCRPSLFTVINDAARVYAADLFNWCAAQRDYPYAQHAEPEPPFWLGCSATETRERVLREWNRSDPSCVSVR